MSGRPLFNAPVITPILTKIVVLVLLLAPFAAASDHGNDWSYEETRDEVRDFAPGGKVHVRLSVGDMRVKRSPDDKIRVHYTVKSRSESRVKDAHLDFEVRGHEAKLDFRTSFAGNNQIDVEIEVPQNTNLDLHEKVGDLTVEDIQGDKDLELGVGDIRVSAERTGYHLVRASSGIGDVNGYGYGETSGWLGKSLKYRGDGKYELRAHVGVGDINLEGK
jgi:hypothetical protein